MEDEIRKFMEETQEVCDKATPGDWQPHGSHVYGPDPERRIICQLHYSGVNAVKEDAANGNLILAARTALPRALQIIREQAEEIQKLKGTI